MSTLLIDIRGGMSIDGVFPRLVLGIDYYGRVTATGGTPFYIYKITEGSLPLGLSLDPITGEVTGIPTSLKMIAITIRATDLQGMYVERPFVIPGAALYAPTPPPLGWWRCNESSGLVLHDASGNGHNGVVNSSSSVYFQDGYLHNSNGISHAATIDLTGVMPKNKQWAFEAVGHRLTGSGTFWATLLSTGQESGLEQSDPGIYANNPNWAARTAYGDALTLNSSDDSSILSHVLLTRDGDESRLYVNGIRADAKTFSAMNTITNTLTLLGEASSTYGPYSIIGRIRDVKIYNTSINDAQANTLYALSGL